MFSIILPGRPCQTDMQTVSPNQFAFSFPAAPHFSHIVVFMLPGNSLPPDMAAGVYMQLPGEAQFKFLGAIANEKQSAIFKVNLPGSNTGGDVDAMTDDNTTNLEPLPGMTPQGQGTGPAASVISLGISVEPTANIQAQLQQLQQERMLLNQNKPQNGAPSTALTTTSRHNPQQPSTKVLAQRIIKNAFNFLASFAAGGQGGREVVPLKSFQDWWTKFERRIENDPGFLERDE